MEGLTIPAYISFFAGFLGFIGLIAGSIFYIKFTATKANLEGKDETIETLKSNRDEWKNKAQETEAENVTLRADKSKLEGEVKTLRELATQTPEILALTKAVTSLTKTVERGQNQIVRYLRKGTTSNEEEAHP